MKRIVRGFFGLVAAAAVLVAFSIGSRADEARDTSQDAQVFVDLVPEKIDLENIEVDLLLKSALFQGEKPEADSPSLLMDIRRDGGVWQRVWAMAGNFNVGHHAGRIESAEVSQEALSLQLSLAIRGDAWVPGGRAIYKVDLKRTSDDRYTGDFSGTFRGEKVRGKAWANIRPPRKKVREDEPAAPGEHPRLLFRKSDLEELRKKAKTPFGRECVKGMKTAAGLAFVYQLTGDEDLPGKVRKLVEEHMASMDNGSKMIRSRVWGWRHEQIALAYDMCYDAWDEDFRREVEQYLVYTSNRIFHAHGLFHAEIGWHLASTYPGTISYGTGLAGLAIRGEKGPKPEKPEAAFCVASDEPVLPPDKDYKPGEDAPVAGFRSGRLPSQWLYAAGFKLQEGDDPLKSMGGPAKARPQAGDKLEHGDRKQVFRPLPSGKKFYYNGQISITDAADRIFWSTSYFFTVVKNDKPRWVRLRTGFGGARVFLNGQELDDKDIVKLEKGLYPMLVVASITETTPWGKHLMKPHLTEMSEKEAREALAAMRAVHKERVEDYEFDLAQWKRHDGADVSYMKLHELSQWLMYRTIREAVGTGGFQMGVTNPMPMEGPNKYAFAHRNALSTEASPYPDIEYYIPRKVFAHVYEGNQAVSQDIAGETEFMIRDVYHETRDTAPDFYAVMFPYVPQKYKPAVLWDWQRRTGVSDPSNPKEILKSARRPYDYQPYDTLRIYALLNYPLQMQAKHPGKVMPHAWYAPDPGWFAFRNGWEGGDDFLTQLYAKAYQSGSGGRRNAGTIRVMGLGHVWSHGKGKPGGNRFEENILYLQEETRDDASAKVTYYKNLGGGSAVVTMDLSQVYSGGEKDKKGRYPELYERYFNVLRPSQLKDIGIDGFRSVAVDYSGKSGAPCLIAMVDVARGAKNPTWQWQLDTTLSSFRRKGKRIPTGTRFPMKTEKADLEGVTLADRSFTITKGDASMVGTFVTPSDVELGAGKRIASWMGFKNSQITATAESIYATGGDTFFVILTIQEGEPPAVKVDGKGLDAKVTVGKRVIRFEDGHLVLDD